MIQQLILSFGRVLFNVVRLRKRATKPEKGAANPSTLAKEVERNVGIEGATRRFLVSFLLPVWMIAGLLDWRHHKRTKIEERAGTHESMIHALMMGEISLPLIMGLFLEVNSLVLALMIGTFFVHEGTAFWDVAYAEGRREVTPNEQHVHSFLEVIPFMVTSFMICLHWDQFLALIGKGNESPRFDLRPKRKPLSKRAISALLAATGATIVFPYEEEFWRCYRTDKSLASHPETRHQ